MNTDVWSSEGAGSAGAGVTAAMLALYPTKAMSFLNCWAVFHPQVANFFEATNSHKMCQELTYLFTILKMNINILV